MAKAKSGSEITVTRLRQAELSACAQLLRTARKLGLVKSLIADVEHAIGLVGAAHGERVKFEKGRRV